MSTYGLKFEGANGQLIFDTDGFPTARTYTVSDTVDSLSNNSTITIPTDALAFGRVSSGNMFGMFNQSTRVLTNNSGQTMNYFFARSSAVASTVSSSGDYGLEILAPPNGGTQEIVFSTRKIANTSLNFKTVFDPGDLADLELVHTGASGSTANLYVSINYMYYSSSAGQVSVVNGFNFTSSQIKYRGFVSGFSGDVPNKGMIAVVELRT